MPELSISIVATNERKVLEKCLRTVLEDVRDLSAEIFVVDNASIDGTSEMLQKEHPQVKVIRNGARKSFCENHDQVINASTGKYVFILNSDIMLQKGHLTELLKVMEGDARIGCVMGKLLLGEPPSRKIDSTGGMIMRSRRTFDRGQGEEDKGQFETLGEVFYTSGAAMLCRRQMLEEIKLFGEYFDTTFYAYKEELDVCWRARLKGWKMMYDPKAVAYHLRGWGLGTKRSRLSRATRRHSYKNRYLMMLKDDHLVNFARDLPHILWHELKALIYMIFMEPHLFLAWPVILRLLPLTMRKRSEIMGHADVGAKEMRKWFI